MSELVELAKIAREHLAAALNALQSNAHVPDELMELAGPIAEAMGVMHTIERTQGANLDRRDLALTNVRTSLDRLQKIGVHHPAVDVVIEAVAASLSKVHALARYTPPAAAPAPAPAAAAVAATQPVPQHAGPASLQNAGSGFASTDPMPRQSPLHGMPMPPAAQPAPQPAQPSPYAAQQAAYAAQQAPYAGQAPHAAQQAAYAAQQAPYAAQQAPYAAHQAPHAAQQAAYAAQQAPHAAQPAPYGAQPSPYAAQPSPQAPANPYAAGAQPAQVTQPIPLTVVAGAGGYAPTVPLPPQAGAPYAAPQPVYAPPPARQAQPAQAQPAQRAQPAQDYPPPPRAAAAATPATGKAIALDVELGTHSPSNFYKGLGGNDVIEHGGIFVATYKIPKIGSTVVLRVLLPGDYEFQANAVVQWTREGGVGGDSAEPGFGARFTQISQEGRQLVYRYTRNREPIFYDDL